MTKTEVIKQGYWPEWFLKGLVSEVPDLSISSKEKLKWLCSIHGEYEHDINSHLRGRGCPICGKLEAAKKIAKSRKDLKEIPEWFYEEVKESPDFNLFSNKEFDYGSKYRFICSIHGEYLQTVSHYLQGHKCPKCGRENSKSSLTRREKNPFSEEFLNTLTDECRDKVENGEIKTHDYADFKCNVHGVYTTKLYQALSGQGCPKCLDRGYRSYREIKICNFLREAGIDFIANYRRLISDGKALEIDIYIPSYNIAFEFNGYYWHHSASFGKPKNYHKLKTELCLKKGIKLYHLWEDCSDELCLSFVKAKLGLCERVYARKCEIREWNNGGFLAINHVDGNCNSVKRWGLFYKGKPYAAISLRFIERGVPEIGRYCTLAGYEVVGGYSRLLKHMIRFLKEKGNKSLFTYCNRDLSPDPYDNFYFNHGFKFLGECSLIMKYYIPKDIEINGIKIDKGVYSRQKFQKHKLMEIMNIDRSDKTEVELAESLGIFPVYNSGNFKYELKL